MAKVRRRYTGCVTCTNQPTNTAPTIQFTMEEEKDDQLPFLDTIIHKRHSSPAFSVYRKPTNKDDFIHFFSAHSRRTKEGVVIGFFLRALRVCSPEFLEAEINHVIKSFQRLRYPRGMLLGLRRKAEKIKNRPKRDNPQEKTQRIVIPHSNLTNHLEALGCNIKIATSAGRKIGDLVKQKRPNHPRPLSQVYSIPCAGCDKIYVGETNKGLHELRLGQHKNLVRLHNVKSALVVHVDTDQHLPNWSQASIIKQGMSLRERKITEAAYIKCTNNINLHPGSHELTKITANLIAGVT